MSAKITQFVAAHITICASSSVSNKELLEAFTKFANTASGRNQLYKTVELMEGVTRTKTHFRGVAIQGTAVMPIISIEKAGLSEYEQKCIELKQRKLELQEALKQKELASQEALKQKELASQEALKQKELEQKQKKLASQEALKQKELASQEALKQKELEQKQKKLTSQEALKQKELDLARELKEIDVAEKEKDRMFMREENNKNRRMHMALRHNKYLDFEVYGNPASQYIARDSIVNVLGFSTYHALAEHKPELLEAITVEANKVSKCVPIYESASTKEVEVLEVSDAIEVIKAVSKRADAPSMMTLVDNIESIQRIAVSDDLRSIPSRYVSKKNQQDPSKHSSGKDKLKYLKAVNKLREQDGKVLVLCTCCHLELDLQSSGCHRAHDIPRADGGDWSTDNVYLTCATCNATMSSQLSVMEFKVDLYVKVLGDQSDETDRSHPQ